MKKVSKAAVREAVQWINEELQARGWGGDWRGVVELWDNHAVSARLKYGQIDLNPRPWTIIRGELKSATMVDSMGVPPPSMQASMKDMVDTIAYHLNLPDDGVPF